MSRTTPTFSKQLGFMKSHLDVDAKGWLRLVVIFALMGGVNRQPVGAQCYLGEVEPAVTDGGQAFGWSLDADSQRVVVGAYYGEGVASGTGAAHVFHRSGIGWALEAELSAPDGVFGDYFGSDVALHEDTILVGAYGVVNSDSTGAVYLYRRVQGVWELQARINPPPQSGLSQFGYALDLQGNLAIISAFADDHGKFTGRAFAYRIDNSSAVLEAVLQPPLEPDAVMGWSVSLDQGQALIGSASSTSKPGVGAAYVFKRNPTEGWELITKFDSPAPSSIAGFGKSVSIRGEWAAVGAYHESVSGHESGAVHLYRKKDMGWIHEAVLVGSDTVSHDYFGTSVDFGHEILIVGAGGKDIDTQLDHGQGYVFRWSHGQWVEQQKLCGSGMKSGDGLGFAVAAAGNSAIISAAAADTPETDAGLVLSFGMLGEDCNSNTVLDSCDIATSVSTDVDANGIPDECQSLVCPWDCAPPANDVVDVGDLLYVLGLWGASGGWTAADVAPPGGNGVIAVDDMLVIVQAWGPCR